MLEVRRYDLKGNRRGGNVALVAFVCAWASAAAGFLIASRYALPALNALAIYPFYLERVIAGRRRDALVLALLWALFLSQAVAAFTYIAPKRAEAVVIRGEVYREEMLDWIRTGDGTESDPKRFIPRHVRDFALFSALALVTGGFGALFLGAVLLNYMNFYVAQLVAASAHPIPTLFLAWQPYAVVRVVGYIFVGTALAETFFGAVTRYRAKWQSVKTYAATGLALVLLDMIIKALTAPLWSRLLKWITGLHE